MPETRFTKNDKIVIAEKICDTHSKRKRDRGHLEKQWEEIDRQVAMEPGFDIMKERKGEIESAKAWMAETELPNQAETLEISCADARRLMVPKGADWFAAHAALTDAYLDRVDFQSLVAGDENEVPSQINQDNADKLVQGLLVNWHNQYDFKGNLDLINAEAFKYSMGVGRGRYVKKRVFLHTTKGVQFKDQKIPVLVPRSIKNTYLDTTCYSLQNEGQIVAPGQIFEYSLNSKDLMMASKTGSTDVNDMNGGWIRNSLKGFDEDCTVQVLEWEGDMVVSRKTAGSLYLANCIISVAVGTKKASKTLEKAIFRIRKNDIPYSSYVLFPYHKEHIDSPYATSPLMKGRVLQGAATQSLNRLMELAALQTQPPLNRDRDSDEDPEVFPGALWGDDVKPVQIGDPQAMLAVYSSLLTQYGDVTGTTSPRLGQQTLSHTTAFSKEAELARAQIRVNDYVDSTLETPLTRWLHMEYEMGRKNMGEQTFYIKPYGGFVRVNKSALPDYVEFEAFGAGQSADEAARFQRRMSSFNQALQMDQLAVSTGQPPTIDLQKAITQVLLEGGWTDVDAITRSEGPVAGAEGAPGVEGGAELAPGVQATALQALAFPRQ